jgi:hypothetical protein
MLLTKYTTPLSLLQLVTIKVKIEEKRTYVKLKDHGTDLTYENEWVRPPCRVSLNCTDRCHCSLILVHWFLVPRSRPLITGHWSSSRCSGSWDPCTAQRNSRSRFLATNFFLFVRLVAW